MVVIFRVLDLRFLDYCMFWVVCNLVYFGFFRFVEFIVSSFVNFLFVIYLGVDDIVVDLDMFFLCLRIRIKVSKIDSFRKGCYVYIGKGEFFLCVIRFLLVYLSLRGNELGFLFLFRDGRLLIRVILLLWLRDILVLVGFYGKFFSYSFRIGVVTVVVRNGILDY